MPLPRFRLRTLMIAVAVAGVVLCSVRYVCTPRTPAVVARRVMRLPTQAQVLTVWPGDYSGEGMVTFHLPRNRPASQWFDVVWDLNRDVIEPGSPIWERNDQKGRYRRAGDGLPFWELHYDSKTRIFRYLKLIDN